MSVVVIDLIDEAKSRIDLARYDLARYVNIFIFVSYFLTIQMFRIFHAKLFTHRYLIADKVERNV